jgi:hydroxyacylglutathione hydrolase
VQNDSILVTPFKNWLFDARSYVLTSDDSPMAVVVDPGNPDIGEICEFLASCRKTLGFVLLTHEHFDHVAGVNSLRMQYGFELLSSGACSQALTDPKENFSRYLTGADFACSPADITCEALGDHLDWAGMTVKFLHTPGHSRGSICIVVGSHLFAGDTLIQGVGTVTKLPGGNKEALRKSVETLMRGLGGNILVHPGHGSEFYFREIKPEIVLGMRHRVLPELPSGGL